VNRVKNLTGMVFDKSGNLYSTTAAGGKPEGGGAVFKLARPTEKNQSWKETLLASFWYKGVFP